MSPTNTSKSEGIPSEEKVPIHLPMPWSEIEKIYIQAMLSRHNGDKKKVAEILGIPIGRLNKRIEKWTKNNVDKKREFSV